MATAAIAEQGEAGKVARTEQIPQLDEELADLDDLDGTNLDLDSGSEADEFELPDEIGEELEFSMDGGEDAGDGLGGLEMDLDDIGDDELIDDTSNRLDSSEIDLTGEFEVDLGDAVDDDEIVSIEDFGETDEDSVVLDIPGFDGEDDTAFAETAVIAPDTAVVTPDFGDSARAEKAGDDDDATSLRDEELNLETGVIKLPTDDDLGESDEDEDISVVDFGDDDFDIDMEDISGETVQTTGTFAPGDFEEPTAETDMEGIDDIDDISELMMPDDVDEVSTKLDLARAFIDMGDSQGARGSLEEVLAEGNDEQKAEARALLEQI